MTDNDSNFRISAYGLPNSQFCVVYAGDRRLCTITLHGDDGNTLQVNVEAKDGGLRNMMTLKSHTSVSWTLNEWFPNDLFDIDFTEDDK